MTEKKLIPLADYNADAVERYRIATSNVPRPNGIACPKCDEEMLDSEPWSTLASNPPQKNVHCPKCDYRGYRVAW